jgi:glycosyltransferase involved in cell wall biosynthesis
MKTINRPSTIALVDTQWTGHHPLYSHKFVECLHAQGHKVFVVCPQPSEVISANAHLLNFGEKVYVSKWNPPSINFSPRRITRPLSERLIYPWLKWHLRQIERKQKTKIDLVFFACLYDRFLARMPATFPWPWIGLYLHIKWCLSKGLSKSLHQDLKNYFSDANLRGLAILDDTAVAEFSRAVGCENIVVFPDFAAEAKPVNNDISKSLRSFANGRRIIGIAGHLTPNKGVVTLAEAAMNMSHDEVVFAFVGEYYRGMFSTQQQEFLDKVFSRHNVFVYPNRIDCDEVWNDVFRTFDVCFAAYEDFPHSSGTVSKSAFFRVPIIVSEGFLMAHRVETYRLGKAVPQRNADALVDAIRVLLQDGGKRISEADADAYLATHSVENLAPALSELVINGLRDTETRSR